MNVIVVSNNSIGHHAFTYVFNTNTLTTSNFGSIIRSFINFICMLQH